MGSMLRPRVDAVKKLKQDLVVWSSSVFLMKLLYVHTPLYGDLPRMECFLFCGVSEQKIAKRHIAPPHCIKLQLTSISCSLVGDFFHFSILL